MITMTMDDIKAMKDMYITPSLAAKVLRMDAGRLIGYARRKELPFQDAVDLFEDRVRIDRKKFLQHYGYEEPEEDKPTVEQLLARLIEIEMDRNMLIAQLIERRAAS